MSGSITQDRTEIEQQLVDLFVSDGMVDRSAIKPDATLESLGIQSVDIMMVLMSIEEKFGVYVPIDEKLSEAKNLEGFINQVVDRIVAEKQKSAS
ncbi:MAG TPA: acyl carrier protein [Xanthobacteraceae bacterium]|jgi:acyl carrier protein|nr:acyl carrier protein [Xanthobacteraceae bacterium]